MKKTETANRNPWSRIIVQPGDSRNANILAQYAADHADWIWHPDWKQADSFVEFELAFTLKKDVSLTFQISADNRFELYADGSYCAMGPDRGDIRHWAFAAYRVSLTKGKHVFTARCMYSEEHQLLAQLMYRPGFLFAVQEEEYRPLFNTGTADWKVRKLGGIEPDHAGYGILEYTFALSDYFAAPEWQTPVVTEAKKADNQWGAFESPRRLHPSNLPEQLRRPYSKKICVRAVKSFKDADCVTFTQKDCQSNDIAKWQKFFDSSKPLTVAPKTKVCILLDFETYICAFPVLDIRGAADGIVRILWKESLTDPDGNKGKRDQVVGKTFGREKHLTVFKSLTEKGGRIAPFWWNAGRYALLELESGSKALELHSLTFEECRYPLENESQIRLNDRLDSVQEMMVRVLQACSHETYMDCPYYEQLMYTGDTRLEILAHYAMSRDGALPLRAVELFNWSRSEWNGLVSERYPSRTPQLSITYTMILPLMLRDYMMYRRFEDPTEFQRLRNGMRHIVTAVSEYLTEDGILAHAPGWSFVDWVNHDWVNGVPVSRKTDRKKAGLAVEVNRSDFAILTLHFMLMLQAMIELEACQPDPLSSGLSAGYKQLFALCQKGIKKYYWVSRSGLFADQKDHATFSIHAQCLAILAHAVPAAACRKICNAMLKKSGILQPTLYFIHYLFDALYHAGQAEKILDYASLWTGMKDLGAVSCWEMPEPTRSDCHAWGAHLYYHYFSSIAGIRPSSPGFRTVSVMPSFGPLTELRGKLTHPDGFIAFDLRKKRTKVAGTITLPPGISGEFRYSSQKFWLHGGKNVLTDDICEKK